VAFQNFAQFPAAVLLTFGDTETGSGVAEHHAIFRQLFRLTTLDVAGPIDPVGTRDVVFEDVGTSTGSRRLVFDENVISL